MYCKNCAAPINPGQPNCANCGTPVGVGVNFCANCAAPVAPGSTVCTNCGSATTAPAAAPGYAPNGSVKIVGGINKTTPFIYCVNKFNTCYTAEIKGNKDCLITYSLDSAYKEEIPISSSISTAFYTPLGKNTRKKLNKIYMQLSAKGNPMIKINGKRLDLGGLKLYMDGDFRKVTVFPPISSFNSVYITISAEEFLNLGELDINYTKLI